MIIAKRKRISLICLAFTFLISFTIFINSSTIVRIFSYSYSTSGSDISASEILSNLVSWIERYWDPIYGGYARSETEEGIIDFRKELQVQGYVARMYLKLYEITENKTYLQKAENILKYINVTFYDPLWGYYASLLTRDHRIISPNGVYSRYGSATYHENILTLKVYLEYYELTGNKSILGWVSFVFENLLKSFTDDIYGGVATIADIWVLGKSPFTQSLTILLAYKLYLQTHKNVYLDIINETITVLRKMWDYGYHHFYYSDYSILNWNRFPIQNVGSSPLLAYAIYSVLFDNRYQEYINVLEYQVLNKYWDYEYVGYPRAWSDDFNIIISRKYLFDHLYVAEDLYLYNTIRYGYNQTIGNRSQELLNIVFTWFYSETKGYFIRTVTREIEQLDKTLDIASNAYATYIFLLDFDGDGILNINETEKLESKWFRSEKSDLESIYEMIITYLPYIILAGAYIIVMVFIIKARKQEKGPESKSYY